MRPHLGAPLERVGWGTALDAVARRLGALRESAAVFTGTPATPELDHQHAKFAALVLGLAPRRPSAVSRAFGLDRGLPGPLSDLTAAGTVFVAGGEPGAVVRGGLESAHGALIVADPRRTPLARAADLHLQLTPDTDVALANGLLQLVVEDGLADEEYIAERTSGFDRVREQARGYWTARVERITGVPEASLREAVRLLAGGTRTVMLSTHENDDQVTAFVNLALALGLPGVAGSGFGRVAGERPPAWSPRMLGADGGPRGLLLFAADPVGAASGAAALETRLSELELLVVADSVLSETALRADIVLPVADEAAELRVLAELARRLGAPGAWSGTPAEVFAELAGDEARPFLDRFATGDGRALFAPVQHRGPDEHIDSEYPLHLTSDPGLPRAAVELHPVLAGRLNVGSGGRVRVVSRHGSRVGEARFSDVLREDTVCLPDDVHGRAARVEPA
ncbi:molybdopterin oxidoreductase family protein [Actinocorallia longicatena]